MEMNTIQSQQSQNVRHAFVLREQCAAPLPRKGRKFIASFLLPFVLFFSLLLASPLRSCDFCNCVTGINPYYNGLNRIGLTTLYQNSHTEGAATGTPGSKLAHGGGTDEHGIRIPETERRITFELSYQHHLSQNLVLTALLPFSAGRLEGDGVLNVYGIGDAALLGQYAVTGLFSERTPATLLLGGGVELPTGANDLRHDDGDRIDPRMQPGSGSFDLIANAVLTAPIESWTVAADLYGKLNNANDRGDRIGNALSLTATLSRDLYRNNPGNFALLGTAGLRGELSGKDRVAGGTDPATGARTLWGNLGGQLVWGHVKLHAAALLPLLQHREPGGANEDLRLTAGIRYEFE